HRVAYILAQRHKRASVGPASWQILCTPKAQIVEPIGPAQTTAIGVAHEGRVIDPLLLRHGKCPEAAKAIAFGLLVAAGGTSDEGSLEVSYPLPDTAVQVRDPPVVLLATADQRGTAGAGSVYHSRRRA